MKDFEDWEFQRGYDESKQAMVDRFFDKTVIDFCDFVDMVTPKIRTLENKPAYVSMDWEEMSLLLCGFCESNNLSYYSFESGESNPLNKALTLSEEEGTDGVVMENISW